MNKILLLTVLSICGFSLKAQTVNDIPIKDIDVEYIQIVGWAKLLSTKLTIEIDFGQRTKIFSLGKTTIIKDENGKDLEFNSMIDALNFMSKNGFEFVTSNVVNSSNDNVYHYLLRNRKFKAKD